MRMAKKGEEDRIWKSCVRKTKFHENDKKGFLSFTFLRGKKK